jgi:hypothetical protein
MSCLDTILFSPTTSAIPLAAVAIGAHINQNFCASCCTSLAARLLFLAQAILSAVALPFSILYTFFHGLYTFYGNGEHATLLCNVARVAAHAAAIPLGLLLLLTPNSYVAKAGDFIVDLRDRWPHIRQVIDPDDEMDLPNLN